MVMLVGLAPLIGWFYFWLRGNWFARVLAFLFFTPLCVAITGTGIYAASGTSTGGAGVAVAWIAAAVLAWFIAGLPVYYHTSHWKHRQILGERVLPKFYEAPGTERY